METRRVECFFGEMKYRTDIIGPGKRNEAQYQTGVILIISTVNMIPKRKKTHSSKRRKRVFHRITNTTLTLSSLDLECHSHSFLLFRLPAIIWRVNCRHSSFVMKARNQNSPANHDMKTRLLGDMGSGDNVFSPFCLSLEKSRPVCIRLSISHLDIS
jgi:hypothetical protein